MSKNHLSQTLKAFWVKLGVLAAFFSFGVLSPSAAYSNWLNYDAVSVSGKPGDKFNLGQLLRDNKIVLDGGIDLTLFHVAASMNIAWLGADRTPTRWVYPSNVINPTSSEESDNFQVDSQGALDGVTVTIGNELTKFLKIYANDTYLTVRISPEIYTPTRVVSVKDVVAAADEFNKRYAGLLSYNGCVDIATILAAEAGMPLTYGISTNERLASPEKSGYWVRVYHSDIDTLANYQSILRVGDIVNTLLNNRVQHTYTVTALQAGSVDTVDNTAAGGTINRHFIRDTSTTGVAVYRLMSVDLPKPTLTLKPGWNLVGNISNQGIVDLQALLKEIASRIDSVWRWNGSLGGRWEYYSASGRKLQNSISNPPPSQIKSGEGFWIYLNGTSNVSLVLPVSNEIGDKFVAPAPIHVLRMGWNLITNNSDQIIDADSFFSSASDQVQGVWKWNSANGNWDFYGPALGSVGSAKYASSSGYGSLTKIFQGEGFWINVTAAGGMTLRLPFVDSISTR